MSKEVDEKVVEMRFDNKNFEKNVATTMGSLDKLKQSLKFKGATDGLKDLEAQAKRTKLSGLGSGIDAVQVKLSALQVAGVTALSRITD